VSIGSMAVEARTLLGRIRAVVQDVDPAARVILFGSRARGDSSPDSDWDILILSDAALSMEQEDTISHRLYDLGLETDSVISVIFNIKGDWASPLYQSMPFQQNVDREGIEL